MGNFPWLCSIIRGIQMVYVCFSSISSRWWTWHRPRALDGAPWSWSTPASFPGRCGVILELSRVLCPCEHGHMPWSVYVISCTYDMWHSRYQEKWHRTCGICNHGMKISKRFNGAQGAARLEWIHPLLEYSKCMKIWILLSANSPL